jgi:hypothetical protein
MKIPDKLRKYIPGYHPRYGTPLAPGKLGEPWWWVPRGNADAWRLVSSVRFLKRAGAAVGVLVIVGLIWGLLHLPPATPPIGPMNTTASNFGPISFRAPIGWTMAGGGGDLTTQPLVLFAPQGDVSRAPATISFLVVDVTANVTILTAQPSSQPSSQIGSNPRTFLDAVIESYLPSAGRGPYCTTDLTYGTVDVGTGLVPVATQITWLETRPLGYLIIPGTSTNLGPCNAHTVTKIVHGPFPTGAATSSAGATAAGATPSTTISVASSASPPPDAAAAYQTLRTDTNNQVTAVLAAMSAAKSDTELDAALKNYIALMEAFKTGLAKITFPVSAAGDVGALLAAANTLETDLTLMAKTPSAKWTAAMKSAYGADATALSTAENALRADLGIGATASPTPAPTPSPTPKPTPAPTAAPSAGGSAASPSSTSAEAAAMVAIQWFALPTGGIFRSENTQKMLVVTFMYPADLSSSDISALTTVFDTVVGSISPSV